MKVCAPAGAGAAASRAGTRAAPSASLGVLAVTPRRRASLAAPGTAGTGDGHRPGRVAGGCRATTGLRMLVSPVTVIAAEPRGEVPEVGRARRKRIEVARGFACGLTSCLGGRRGDCDDRAGKGQDR